MCGVANGSLCFIFSNLIKRHSLSVHLIANNIQIETSILPQHVHSAISSVEICISDVKYWMVENKLQFNDEKRNVFLYVQINAQKN